MYHYKTTAFSRQKDLSKDQNSRTHIDLYWLDLSLNQSLCWRIDE